MYKKDLRSGKIMRHKVFQKIPKEEEVLLGEFDNDRIMENKMEIENWKWNGVFGEVRQILVRRQ